MAEQPIPQSMPTRPAPPADVQPYIIINGGKAALAGVRATPRLSLGLGAGGPLRRV